MIRDIEVKDWLPGNLVWHKSIFPPPTLCFALFPSGVSDSMSSDDSDPQADSSEPAHGPPEQSFGPAASVPILDPKVLCSRLSLPARNLPFWFQKEGAVRQRWGRGRLCREPQPVLSAHQGSQRLDDGVPCSPEHQVHNPT